MNKRHGMEAMLGLGGGIVSPASRRNLEKAEDLCRKRKPDQAIPYLIAAIQENPDNLDAVIQMAFLAPNIQETVEILETAEIQGKAIVRRCLGRDCFEDGNENVGHFWGLLETRPYMRVLQALVRMYFEAGRYTDSEKTVIEMLRLCPGDNCGQRFWLGSVLIRNGRFSEALSFSQNWLHDSSGDSPLRGGTVFVTPSRKLISANEESELGRWGDGSILHTAALASFKLFGDCEQSRQYLRIAVKAQPHILLKVLAKVSRPKNLNMGSRSRNGPEDAQDYLWLTQDLWMESPVWNWANKSDDVLQVILKDCSRKGCPQRENKVAEYKRCSACHLVRYCGAECQRMDWPVHKIACKEHNARKAQLKAMGF